MGCLFVAMVGLSGYGRDHPPLYPVMGKVVFADGTPLAIGGMIVFEPIASEGERVTESGNLHHARAHRWQPVESDGAVRLRSTTVLSERPNR